jgi:hypothetical protein
MRKVEKKNFSEMGREVWNDKISRDELNQWAQSTSTSMEVAKEIWSYPDPQRVWENPTKKEFNTIMRKAFMRTDDDILKWGVETVKREDILFESKKVEEKNLIEITKDVKISEDFILEEGDKIEILDESTDSAFSMAEDMVIDIFGGDYEAAFKEVIMGMSDDEVRDAVNHIYRMWQ